MKSALKETLGDDTVRDRLRNVYACETAGHAINWTPVEEIYTAVRRA